MSDLRVPGGTPVVGASTNEHDVRERATAFTGREPAGGAGGYEEFPPPDGPRDLVECFWHRGAGTAPSISLVLPDGCIDIVWMGEAPPVVAGPATRPTRVDIAAGIEVTGVRFRPGAAPGLLGVAASELVNAHVPLRDIWPRTQAAKWDEAMAHAGSAKRLESIAEAIAARQTRSGAPDRVVRGIVAWLVRHPRGRLDDLVQLTGLSERQVRRRVDEAVGYGPKTLQRVLRLQRLLWLVETAGETEPSLSRLALAAGYADQPHMTREATALTGMTPRGLLCRTRRGSALSDLFKTASGRDATMVL